MYLKGGEVLKIGFLIVMLLELNRLELNKQYYFCFLGSSQEALWPKSLSVSPGGGVPSRGRPSAGCRGDSCKQRPHSDVTCLSHSHVPR